MSTKHEIALLKKAAKTKKERQVYKNTDEKSNKMITHKKENQIRAAKSSCF